MPEWLAPFHLPKFTNEEYLEMKYQYVKKHGYTVSMPGLDDVLKIGQTDPMTDEEKESYKKKRWDDFRADRLDEITEMKWKKKQRFLAMLGSPAPNMVTNAGSIMCALDDAQDAISTLAVIAKMAVHAAPRILGKLFAGPAGWLMLASDLMTVGSYISSTTLMQMPAKRLQEDVTISSPFSKKAKLRRARKLSKVMPTKGDVIQALQTTDQVFGFGICLGPIVGAAVDVVAGTLRAAIGERVKVRWHPPKYDRRIAFAKRTMKSVTLFSSGEWHSDDSMFLEILMANYFAQQTIMPDQQEWNPLEMIDNLANAQIQAPIPTDPLTLEIMEEEKTPVEEFTGWLHSGEKWAHMDELAEVTQEPAADNLRRLVERNNHSWDGYASGVLACEASTYTLANLEGEGEVEYDYTAQSKMVSNLLKNGYMLDPDQPPDRLARFEEIMDEVESTGAPTSFKMIQKYCMWNGIRLISFPQ